MVERAAAPVPVVERTSIPPPVLRPNPPEEIPTFSLREGPYDGRSFVTLDEVETFSLCSEPFSHSNFDGVQIRPVHVEPSKVTPLPPLIVKHLFQTLEQPKFSGNPCDWIQFREDWDYYMAKISAAHQVSNEAKVELLENCLDEVNRRQLRVDRKKGL